MYNFYDIKGNEQIIKNLKLSIINDRVSHSYIFNAPKGMGKKLLANTFAKALQCKNRTENAEPCGICHSCKTFDFANHTDIIYVKPQKTKSIGVDDVRNLIIKNAEIKPFENNYKIFIIEQADKLTIQAQNALLKTIEEPPTYAVFILLSENTDAFLPTVLSRCITFKFIPLKTNVVSKYLSQTNSIDFDEAYMYASCSGGNIGKALETAASETFSQMRHDIINTAVSLTEKDLIGIFSSVSCFENYKDNIQEALDILYMFYRDAATVKLFGENSKFVIQRDKKSILKNFVSKFSGKSIFDKCDVILDAKKNLKFNSNFQMTLEVMLLKLKEN